MAVLAVLAAWVFVSLGGIGAFMALVKLRTAFARKPDGPLDPRDVDLWGRQIIAADADQIMNEATR